MEDMYWFSCPGGKTFPVFPCRQWYLLFTEYMFHLPVWKQAAIPTCLKGKIARQGVTLCCA